MRELWIQRAEHRCRWFALAGTPLSHRALFDVDSSSLPHAGSSPPARAGPSPVSVGGIWRRRITRQRRRVAFNAHVHTSRSAGRKASPHRTGTTDTRPVRRTVPAVSGRAPLGNAFQQPRCGSRIIYGCREEGFGAASRRRRVAFPARAAFRIHHEPSLVVYVGRRRIRAANTEGFYRDLQQIQSFPHEVVGKGSAVARSGWARRLYRRSFSALRGLLLV